MIIGISGKTNSGKDTVAEVLKETLHNQSYYIDRFARPLKSALAAMFGISVEMFESQEFKSSTLIYDKTVRDMMISLGNDWGRNSINPNLWIDLVLSDAKSKNVIIADVRYKNEADAIRDMGGVLIRINRDSINKIDNQSENDLDDYEFDYVIENDSTIFDLYVKTKNIALQLQ